ncbi:uncharacterized protein LOC135438076 isoform X1 [Drosophila montana]|uniref:uncharacterized protein LOC135438076 isoform X1 n=1 Tax=Drosophila montana TaxID=40370 RepID=UPI00313EFCEC
MFDKLNEDCWLTILKYVKLSDQLALAQISNSLQCTVRYHWQHLKEAHLDHDVLDRFEQHPNEMQEFVQLASGSLQRLILKRASMALLESWKSYRFPKLVSLSCDMCFTSQEAADEETLLLTELFPHLTQLTLLSSTSGRHLWTWDKLEELHLMCCESLDTSTFEQIFSSMPLRKLTLLFYGYSVNLGEGVLPVSKCATLEELVIDDHHLLGAFLPNLLQLPRFRRLAFYTRDYYEGLLLTVAKLRPLKVKSLLFNDAFWSSSRVSDVITRMSNLRCLALYDDDIETKELYNICAILPQLEELHLMKMRALPTPTQLWDIVAACKTLKVLNLSSSQLDKQFLDLSATCLDRVLRKRNASSPLTLHLHNTVLERSPSKVFPELNHPNLNISFEAVDLNVWSSRFIEIIFYTSVN